MLRIIFCLAILMLFVSTEFAQQNTENNKFEIFGGYSNNQVESSAGTIDSAGNFSKSRDSHNGFEVSGTGNINRYFGIKGDFSAVFRSGDNFSSSSVYNLLGGIQIKDNAGKGSRFRPFAHALVGTALTQSVTDYSKLAPQTCVQLKVSCSKFNTNNSGLAVAIGGGLDIKATKRMTIRAIQIDYNPIHVDTNTQDNVRFSIGFVFH